MGTKGEIQSLEKVEALVTPPTNFGSISKRGSEATVQSIIWVAQKSFKP